MNVVLALPSKGAIAEPTTNFLKDCGLRIHKPNPRQYTGTLPAVPTVDVLFQRVKDIVYKVSDGTATLGITGLDVVAEQPHEDLIVVHDALGYGHCQLLVAVPQTWVDVETMSDLVDVALDFREFKQRNLRVATTYTNLARKFLHAAGIHHFTLVKAEGAIEAAPTLGYADIVIDLTQTGTTLRENHLKIIEDGVIVDSQACLIANKRVLQTNLEMLDTVRVLLEYMDAALQGRRYYQLTANIQGKDPDSIAQQLVDNPITRGLQGPTIAPIYAMNNHEQQWHTLTLTVSSKDLLDAVEYLRKVGGTQTSVVPLSYLFLEESLTFTKLLAQMEY
ncbi:MAG: ATP phosphoribosyltransferase [Anaerolineae bacterium]|nr:ATP phosphoribosyltransferase [Anaerolineae bacterium]